MIKALSGGLAITALAALTSGLVACSSPENGGEILGGGVTDIGNSVAVNVLDKNGQPVRMARVVAYYDKWNDVKVKDSVVAEMDSNGSYNLKLDSNETFVLYATDGEKSGQINPLFHGDGKDSVYSIVIDETFALSGHIEDKLHGYMRLVGSDEKAPLDADGYFIFYQVPRGDVSLTYVEESATTARMDFSTEDNAAITVFPALQALDTNESWLTISDYRYYANESFGGIVMHVPSYVVVPKEPVMNDDTTQVEPAVDSIQHHALPLNKFSESMRGFVCPVKVDTKFFGDTINPSEIVVTNNDRLELFPSEIEFWNDSTALLWIRLDEESMVDSSVLNVKVFKNPSLASSLLPFGIMQTVEGALVRYHFNGDARVMNDDGTLATSVADSTGILGKGITLNPGQYIPVDSIDPGLGDFTLSLWTKWEGPNGKLQILGSEKVKGNEVGTWFQWVYDDEKSKFGVTKTLAGFSDTVYFGGADIVPVGEWAYLSLAFKMETVGKIAMYVNGVPQGDGLYEFIPNPMKFFVPFRIGGREGSTENWNGALDEIRLENVARSPEWLQANYQMQMFAAN